MAGVNCDVCDESPTIGVFSSALGAVAFAYCKPCIQARAEPWGALVFTVADADGMENLASWFQQIVEGTMARLGKTQEDFNRDVAEAKKTLEKEYAKLEAADEH